MKSYIFIGGEVEKSALEIAIPENALVIAADSGYDNAKSLGYAERCDFIVGDFDSTKERAFCSRAKITIPIILSYFALSVKRKRNFYFFVGKTCFFLSNPL